MIEGGEWLRNWLVSGTELAVLAIDSMALVIVLAGSIQAFVAACRSMAFGSHTDAQRREIWLRYARVLVAALTFQLAVDIIETSIAADWKGLARLAILAVIRTFLNYFLERDLSEIRERQAADPESAAGPPVRPTLPRSGS